MMGLWFTMGLWWGKYDGFMVYDWFYDGVNMMGLWFTMGLWWGKYDGFMVYDGFMMG